MEKKPYDFRNYSIKEIENIYQCTAIYALTALDILEQAGSKQMAKK